MKQQHNQYKQFGFSLVQVLIAVALLLGSTACTPEMFQKAVVIDELMTNAQFFSVLQPGNIPQIFVVYQNEIKGLYGTGWVNIPGNGLPPKLSGGLVSKEGAARLLETLNRMPKLLPGMPAPHTNGFATRITWAQIPNEIRVFIVDSIVALTAVAGGIPMVTAIFTYSSGLAEFDKLINPVGIPQ